MKNHFLFIGDRFGGIEPGLGDLLANLLLVDYPAIPFNFSIHASHRNTLDSLYQNCARDIIGRQAGTTVLWAGWEDLTSSLSPEQILAQQSSLVSEIRHNSQSRIFACTLPAHQLPSGSITQAKAHAFNEGYRAMATEGTLLLIDLEESLHSYQSAQMVRGELVRYLFTDHGTLNDLGQLFCAKDIALKIMKS